MTNKQTPTETINTLISTIRLRGEMATNYEQVILELDSGDESVELMAMEGLRAMGQDLRKNPYTPTEVQTMYTGIIDELEKLLKSISRTMEKNGE